MYRKLSGGGPDTKGRRSAGHHLGHLKHVFRLSLFLFCQVKDIRLFNNRSSTHRLTEKSGIFSHFGENQTKEIIRTCRFSVFLVDEDQKVTLKDIVDIDEIRIWSKKLNASVTDLALESQIRCTGMQGVNPRKSKG
jgi:hypothetical protein